MKLFYKGTTLRYLQIGRQVTLLTMWFKPCLKVNFRAYAPSLVIRINNLLRIFVTANISKAQNDYSATSIV